MTAGDGARRRSCASGDAGPAVRDLQERLTRCGHAVTFDGIFGDGDPRARCASSRPQRGLRVDGICGPETWGALIESSYALGDRLLYSRAPMLRGDDVIDLQRRLNALGFDAGREDGILGPETETALRQFQREHGLEPDGVCGPATDHRARARRHARGRIGRVGARTRHAAPPRAPAARPAPVPRRRSRPRRARRRRPRRRLLDEGAIVALDTSGDEHDVLAAQANAFGADVCIAIGDRHRARRAVRVLREPDVPHRGRPVPRRTASPSTLRTVLPRVDEPTGRTYRLLRETRMAAVVCELFSRDEPTGRVAAHVDADPSSRGALAARRPQGHRRADRRRANRRAARDLSAVGRLASVMTR